MVNKKNTVYINIILTCFSFLIFTNAVTAQKLPNVQETSLRAPAALKVDGKATELNNQFQAYNKTTEIFYTLSNDNNNLYLTVQATDLDIINKIVCAGITLTINGTGKMKDQEGVAITFPILNEDAFPSGALGGAYGAPPINLDKPDSWSADSFMVALNKHFASIAKDIKVTGVKEITSSLISIYNPEGIKAVAHFDNKTVYTYELAVPLKYLGLSVNSPKPFVYNIKLVSMNADSRPGLSPLAAAAVAARVQRPAIRQPLKPRFNPDTQTIDVTGSTAQRFNSLVSPTDFWGEYTLNK